MEHPTSQKRHKSAPNEKSLPRPWSSLDRHARDRSMSPGHSTSYDAFDLEENSMRLSVEAVSFETVYISPTRVRASLSRINIAQNRSFESDTHRFMTKSTNSFEKRRKRSFSSPNSAFEPASSSHSKRSIVSHRSPSSSSSSNQFRSFQDIYRHVEKRREKLLSSPLVSTLPHSDTSFATSKNRVYASSIASSSTSASPSVSSTSPKKEISVTKSPEFEYFEEVERKPKEFNRWRPSLVSKEEYDEIEDLKKNVEENARRLRELAKKEKEVQKKAYEEFRSPPVTVARRPVAWPQDWEEVEEKVRYGSELETLCIQKAGEQIQRRDLQFLLDQEWLNDVCINSYIHLLRQRSANAMTSENVPVWPRTFMFGSFLLDQLCNGKNGYNYDAVRRVTVRAKVDIFQMEKILIPFHLGNHWCMACINFSLKRFEYYDSLGGSNSACIQALKRYLDDEFKNKIGPQGFDTSSWTIFVPKNIPHQVNGFDCGVFALSYANYLSRNLPFDFTQSDMPAIRAKFISQILSNEPLPLNND
jgi:sentrin-specific protease 1